MDSNVDTNLSCHCAFIKTSSKILNRNISHWRWLSIKTNMDAENIKSIWFLLKEKPYLYLQNYTKWVYQKCLPFEFKRSMYSLRVVYLLPWD